jgi:hypothetical protein
MLGALSAKLFQMGFISNMGFHFAISEAVEQVGADAPAAPAV